MTEDFGLPEQGTDSTPVPQTPPSGQPDLSKFVPVERFTGLQGHAQKVQLENKELKSKLHDLMQEVEGKTMSLATERDTLSQQLQTTLKEYEQATTKVKALERHQALGGLITEKFPSLATLHAKGRISTDLEGEALEKFLADYASDIDTLVSTGKRGQSEGAVPPPPAGTPATMSKDDIWEKMMKMNPSTPEYKTLEEQLFKFA